MIHVCIRTLNLELSIMVRYRIFSIVIMVFVKEKILHLSLLVIFEWFRKQFGWKKNAIGLISLTEDPEQELDTYLKLFILLHADDKAILAESSDDMQNQINYFYDFCKKWRLKVNIEKSKVLFFFEWSPTK
jgi:hypothetical protein